MSKTPPVEDWVVQAAKLADETRAVLVDALGADGAAGVEAAVKFPVQRLRVYPEPLFTIVSVSGASDCYVGAGSHWVPVNGVAGFAALLQQVAHLDPIKNVALLEQACRRAFIDMVRDVKAFREATVTGSGVERRNAEALQLRFEPPHRVGPDFTFIGLVHLTRGSPRQLCRFTVRGETFAIDMEQLGNETTQQDLERARIEADRVRRDGPPPVAEMTALIQARIRKDGAVSAAEPVLVAIRADHDNEGCDYRALVAWFDARGKVAWRAVVASTVNGFAAGMTDGPNDPPWWARLQVGDRFVPR